MNRETITKERNGKPAVKISVLLSFLILLFLSACGTSPVKDDLPASPELDVLVLGVETMAKKREPAGDVKRAEDAQNVGDVWGLAMDLEEVDWLHEEDKLNIVEFVTKAVERIKESYRECSQLDRFLNRRECR